MPSSPVDPEFRLAIGRVPRTREEHDALLARIKSKDFEDETFGRRCIAIAQWLDARDQLFGAHAFVYAAHANGMVKIGFSKNPIKRVSALRTGVPQLRLVGVTWGTRTDEQMAHKLLAEHCVGGEWFRLDAPEVRSFVLQFLSGGI